MIDRVRYLYVSFAVMISQTNNSSRLQGRPLLVAAILKRWGEVSQDVVNRSVHVHMCAVRMIVVTVDHFLMGGEMRGGEAQVQRAFD